MTSEKGKGDQGHLETAHLYALRALAANEIPAFELHLSTCSDCRQEVETLQPIIDSFASWPTDVLRPSSFLWTRLSQRIAEESGAEPLLPPAESTPDPEWEEAAPGIFCKMLSVDAVRNRVTMLVRLAPGTDYPPHRHADIEELHLLNGELRVDDKMLYPGDFIRAQAGSVDHRVWSETGCTCLLLTSTEDAIL